MSWKILVTARTFKDVGSAGLKLLQTSGCEVITPPRSGPLEAAELLEALGGGIDAVLASPDAYNAAVLASPQAARLKVISRWGVGYDSIDISAATHSGVVVAYTPGLLDDTVADYTFALLLGLARRLPEGHFAMRNGEWQMIWGSDVSGKTLGIVGCGRIGQAVARRALGFNMGLLGYDVLASEQARALGINMVSLEQLLAESDYVTLHAALTAQNRGLIGEAQFRQMKPTAYLINAGRGALVDEDALVRALNEGWIAGAALDTFAREPLAADHPLRRSSKVLLTPHLASFARETGERVSLAAARAIVDLMEGRKPKSVVNPSVFEAPNLRVKL